MALSGWHTTASDNATVGSINWAEGQPPSTVNDSSRQEMADVRSWYEDAQWINYGHTYSIVNSTVFEVAGDYLSRYSPGRRLRAYTNSVTHTCYGVIDYSYTAAGNTIVRFTPEEGEFLNVTLSAVALHQITYEGQPTITVRNEPANVIHNGAFDIAQTGTVFSASAGVTSALVRTVDSWTMGIGTTVSSVWGISRGTADVPSIGQTGVYIPYSLRATASVVETAAATADYVIIQQLVEGFYARPILYRTFTVGFWAKVSETGVYSLAVRSSDSGSSYVGEYTISTAGTWIWREVHIPAGPAGAVWGERNTAAINLSWAMVVGSTYNVTAGAWVSGNYLASTAQPNVASAVGGYIAITGVTLSPGGRAMKYYPLSFEKEVERAQRYFQKSYNLDVNPGTSSNVGIHALVVENTTAGVNRRPSDNPRFLTRMRDTPAITIYSASGVAGLVYDNITTQNYSATVGLAGESGFHMTLENELSSTESHGITYHWIADARY